MRKISLAVVTGALGIALVLAGAAMARSTASSIQLIHRDGHEVGHRKPDDVTSTRSGIGRRDPRRAARDPLTITPSKPESKRECSLVGRPHRAS